MRGPALGALRAGGHTRGAARGLADSRRVQVGGVRRPPKAAAPGRGAWLRLAAGGLRRRARTPPGGPLTERTASPEGGCGRPAGKGRPGRGLPQALQGSGTGRGSCPRWEPWGGGSGEGRAWRVGAQTKEGRSGTGPAGGCGRPRAPARPPTWALVPAAPPRLLLAGSCPLGRRLPPRAARRPSCRRARARPRPSPPAGRRAPPLPRDPRPAKVAPPRPPPGARGWGLRPRGVAGARERGGVGSAAPGPPEWGLACPRSPREPGPGPEAGRAGVSGGQRWQNGRSGGRRSGIPTPSPGAGRGPAQGPATEEVPFWNE